VGFARLDQTSAFPRLAYIQDILLVDFECAAIKHPFITPAHLQCPLYRNTIARLLRNM